MVDKDMSRDVVIVAPGHDHPALYRRSVSINTQDFTWTMGTLPDALQRTGGGSTLRRTRTCSRAASLGDTVRCMARTRHREPLVGCVVRRSVGGDYSPDVTPESASLGASLEASLGEAPEIRVDNDVLEVIFDEPQRAATIGQTLALYVDEVGPSNGSSGGVAGGGGDSSDGGDDGDSVGSGASNVWACLGGGPLVGFGPSLWDEEQHGKNENVM